MRLYGLLRVIANLPVIRTLKSLVPVRPNYRLNFLHAMPKGANCAELGVWKGEFSGQIIEITKPERLHLVDPWAYQPQYPHRMYGGTVAQGQRDMDEINARIKSEFSDLDNVEIHRMTSKKFLENFDEKLDWIYIDGDHSTEAVSQDLNLSRAIMNQSGIIAGDDYYWKDADGSLSVKIAVDAFCSEHGYKRELIGDQFIIRLTRDERRAY